MADSQPGTKITQPCRPSWITFRLVDRDDNPVPGEAYKVRLPDQSVITGNLDREGKVRIDGIVPGQASICFPGMDRKEWRRI